MAKINLSLLGKAWERIKAGFDWFTNKAVLSTRTPVSNSYRYRLLNRELSDPASQAKFPTGTYLDKMPGIPKPQVVQTTKPYVIENLPGYMIRSLMRENPLQKQLSKQGTISVNSILAHAQKGSAMEKEIINKVLQEQFAGQDRIDYNAFRRAVQNYIPQYNRVPQAKYSTYGMQRIGFNESKQPDGAGRILSYVPGVRTATFTFESPGIKGNTQHYEGSPIGHSRTYTTPEEPGVLHVMESQSDWAQGPRGLKRSEKLALANIDEEIAHIKSGGEPRGFDDLPTLEKKKREIISAANARKGDLQQEYMKDTYLERQLQENLKYAAENGQTKMRYPTRETAAKIEGYLPSKSRFFDKSGNEVNEGTARGYDTVLQKMHEIDKKIENLKKEIDSVGNVQFLGNLDAYQDFINWLDGNIAYMRAEEHSPSDLKSALAIRDRESKRLKWMREHPKEVEDFAKQLETLQNEHFGLESLPVESKLQPGYTAVFEYRPEFQTILKKYQDFPKQYRKLFGGEDVRTITDPKGNTWYEVDVPNNYLNMEWQYKQGGTINYLNYF